MEAFLFLKNLFLFYICFLKPLTMAKEIIIDTTIEIIEHEGELYVTMPLGTTGFHPDEKQIKQTRTENGKWEEEYNTGNQIQDDSSPPFVASHYFGGRPKRI